MIAKSLTREVKYLKTMIMTDSKINRACLFQERASEKFETGLLS